MWDAIKRDISDIGELTLTGIFILAVFILVLIHVFGLSAGDIKKLLATDTKNTEAQLKKPASKSNPNLKSKLKLKQKGSSNSKVNQKVIGNEVRQYSEFVTVNHPTLGLTITTGIRYDNSTNQKVVSQWCYAQKSKTKKDGFSVHLSIKKIDQGKTQSFAPYSVQTLREFGLTQSQANGLTSYCRFK